MPVLPPDNIIVETIILNKSKDNEKMCSRAGQFCLEIINRDNKNTLYLYMKKAGQADLQLKIFVDDNEQSGFGRTDVNIYPNLYLIKDKNNNQIKFAFIGVLSHSSDMYSGGGASGDFLTLYYASNFLTNEGVTEGAKPVLNLPIHGYKMIRACFSEREYKTRNYSCHDEYRFDATIKPNQKFINSMPIFEYSSSAANFPIGVSLSKDSTQI